MGVRAELRGLKDLLRPGERILTAGVGARGRSCGLLVTTDQRLLLTNKWPLRPQRCEELPYERIASLSVVNQGGTDRLTIETADQQLSFNVVPDGRAAEMAGIVAQRIGAGKVSGAVYGARAVGQRHLPVIWDVTVQRFERLRTGTLGMVIDDEQL